LVDVTVVAARDIAELVVEDFRLVKRRLDVDAAGVQKTEILDRRCLRAWVGEVGIAIHGEYGAALTHD